MVRDNHKLNTQLVHKTTPGIMIIKILTMRECNGNKGYMERE